MASEEEGLKKHMSAYGCKPAILPSSHMMIVGDKRHLKKELICHIDVNTTKCILACIKLNKGLYPSNSYYMILFTSCYHYFVNGVKDYISIIIYNPDRLLSWFVQSLYYFPKLTFDETLLSVYKYFNCDVELIHDTVGNMYINDDDALQENVDSDCIDHMNMLSYDSSLQIKLFGNEYHRMVEYMSIWRESQYCVNINDKIFDAKMRSFIKNVRDYDEVLMKEFKSLLKKQYIEQGMGEGKGWKHKLNDLSMLRYNLKLHKEYNDSKTKCIILSLFPKKLHLYVDQWFSNNHKLSPR